MKTPIAIVISVTMLATVWGATLSPARAKQLSTSYLLKFSNGSAWQRNLLRIDGIRGDLLTGRIVIDWSPGPVSREPLAHETSYNEPYSAQYDHKTGCFSFEVVIKPRVAPPVAEAKAVKYAFELCRMTHNQKTIIVGIGSRSNLGTTGQPPILFGVYGQPSKAAP